MGKPEFPSGILVSPVALTDAATIAVDASLGGLFRVTLAGNRTLGNPTNVSDGQLMMFEIKQDATGSRTIAFGSNYRGGTDLTLASIVLSTGANLMDRILCQVRGSLIDVIGFKKGFPNT